MAEGGIEHAGYIDIKQPPKVKGRKLKSWKKKWVVLHEMSIRASDRPAAKVDVYADEKTAAKSPADKHTFILEYVTAIRVAKSKTHAHAFEIVENEAVLLFSGHTELESQTWISAFRKIFWPQEIENHCFDVTILPNEHTQRLSLEGAYVMTITPEVIGIDSDTHNSYEWSLPMLKRFHLNPDPDFADKEALVIECGPKSECGQATFLFRSEDVAAILASIKKNIFIAINMKKCATASQAKNPQPEKKWRNSVTSGNSTEDRQRSDTLSSSEQRYRELLDPPMPDSKRSRLMSNGSVPSMAGSDKISVKSVNTETTSPTAEISETPDFPAKKRTSVTFETPQEVPKKETTDILSTPIDSKDNQEEDEYNRVLFNAPLVSQPPSSIITTFTIAQPGYQTKVLLDDRGYSHVSFKDQKPVVEEDKTRSLSNISSHSSMSNRSASVGSRDSGIPYQAADKGDHFSRAAVVNRSTHSFDSAVSTSSALETTEIGAVDTSPTNLKVKIEAVEVDASGQIIGSNEADNGIYQDVSIDEENSRAMEKAAPKLTKSNSTGNCRNDENEYEDLEKYQKGKKNLVKHLGMDPSIDPKSVPPALPARPLSQKMRRKFNHERKLFTLPFVKHRSRKAKEIAASTSSSSDSDSESGRDGKTNADVTLKKWPLGDNSVMVGNNELYQPIAIERFLNDEEDNVVHNMRERSSSLNLNMSSSLTRDSVCLDKHATDDDRKTTMWKHNRNASMNIEVMQRKNDPSADSGWKQRYNMVLQNETVDESIFESEVKGTENVDDRMRADSNCSSIMDDEEPIYAEVGPCTKSSGGALENPFPDIDGWKAHEDHSHMFDTTHYENDDSVNSSKNGDVFNQGFVSQTDKVNSQGKQPELLLIDLSDEQSDCNPTLQPETKVASVVDVFNMENDPILGDAPIIPAPSDFVDIFHLGIYTPQTKSSQMPTPNTSSSPEPEMSPCTEITDDAIYMDMTSCKHESIYVMPSSLKQ